MDLSLYRLNVGVVLINREGLVWYGRRAGATGAHTWQFPQGGVDEGEDFEAAAVRELYEETGITSAEFLASTEGWITYDFPPDYGGSKQARGFKGQRQRWFAFRFTGEDTEVNLAAHGEVEFDAWRWGRLSEATDLIVPFKREAYARVVTAFRALCAD